MIGDDCFWREGAIISANIGPADFHTSEARLRQETHRFVADAATVQDACKARL